MNASSLGNQLTLWLFNFSKLVAYRHWLMRRGSATCSAISGMRRSLHGARDLGPHESRHLATLVRWKNPTGTRCVRSSRPNERRLRCAVLPELRAHFCFYSLRQRAHYFMKSTPLEWKNALCRNRTHTLEKENNVQSRPSLSTHFCVHFPHGFSSRREIFFFSLLSLLLLETKLYDFHQYYQ